MLYCPNEQPKWHRFLEEWSTSLQNNHFLKKNTSNTTSATTAKGRYFLMSAYSATAAKDSTDVNHGHQMPRKFLDCQLPLHFHY
jgi:hypothetical protein